MSETSEVKSVQDLPTGSSSSVCEKTIVPKEYLVAFALLVIPFALWGAANNMTDLLVPTFQKVKSMSQLHASLIQVAFYGAYFFMAIPAAILIKKFSYKTGTVSGLFIYALGAALCYPASQADSFTFFLVAFYVFASGCAILETCVAPHVISLGPEATATQRINLAQSFNPIGSIAGLFLGKFVILAGLGDADADARAAMAPEALAELQNKELSNVVTAYMIVGLASLVLGAIILFKKFPKGHEADEDADDHLPENGFGPTIGRLLKNKNYLMAVVSQFFFVGAQIGVWTYTIKYLLENIKEPLQKSVDVAVAAGEKATLESEAATYTIVGLFLFAASRFICTALMKVIDPARLLSIVSAIAVVLTAVVIWVGGQTGAYALVAISACMSLMFPTIYGLGLTGLNDNDRKVGGSGIIMTIVGGAILVPTQGALIDKMGVNLCYILPLITFVIVCVFGFIAHSKEEEAGIA